MHTPTELNFQTLKKLYALGKRSNEAEIHAHPWRNFFGILFWNCLIFGFGSLGYLFSENFFTSLHLWLWFGICGVLQAVGIFALGNQIVFLIRRGKSK